MKRAKVTSAHKISHKIKHEDNSDCLQHLKTFSEKQMRIGQDAHNLYSLEQNEITLFFKIKDLF